MSQPWVPTPLFFTASQARLRLGRAFAACLLVAVGVIVLAMVVHPPQVRQVATATASCPAGPLAGGSDSAARWAYRERLRQAVLSETFLVAAMRRATQQGTGSPEDWPSPTVVRGWIDAAVQPSATEDGVEVRFTCRAEDADRACRLAQALAEEAIAWSAGELSQATLASRHTAETAVEHARKRYRQAKTRLESFLDEHFAGQPSGAKSGPKTPADQSQHVAGSAGPSDAAKKSAGGPVKPGGPQTADSRGLGLQNAAHLAHAPENPQWVRLTAQLETLRSELAIMLIERTPAHPAVQDLQRRIRELEVHLEAVPRFLPTGDPEKGVNPQEQVNGSAGVKRLDIAAPGSGEDASPGGEIVAQSATLLEAAQTYRNHKAEWLLAEQALAAAEDNERRFWAQWAEGVRASGPAVVRLPGAARVEGRHRDWSHLVTLALAAGLTVAFGTVLISAGLEIDTPLVSADQARKCLNAPVIGSVRVAGEKLPTPLRSTLRLRSGLLAAGGLVIAGCVALVALAL